MAVSLKWTIDTPSGEQSEIVELKEGSTIEFYRSDLKRYQAPIDEIVSA
jgi:hypothetical protein